MQALKQTYTGKKIIKAPKKANRPEDYTGTQNKPIQARKLYTDT